MSSWKTHPRLMIPIQFQSIVGFDLMVLNQFVGEVQSIVAASRGPKRRRGSKCSDDCLALKCVLGSEEFRSVRGGAEAQRVAQRVGAGAQPT